MTNEDAARKTGTSATRPCLIVVDDDGTIREMLRVGLESLYEMVCLSSGEAVIEAIDRHHPRLLVLDVNMPGADGYEICDRVRAEARLRRLPVLFITVRKDDATFLKSLQSGGNALLEKPFEIEAFREKVRQLLLGGAGGGAPLS
jgi:two-component system phosphate regulon response regulator PhoB